MSGSEALEASIFAPARKIDCLQVGKKPCLLRTYSANLRIRSRFGAMSRAGVPGAAERCSRALPEEIKALPAARRSRELRRVRAAGTSQSAHWLRANRALRHGPRAHHGSWCWASGRQLGRRRILGRLTGGRRGAAWPLTARGAGWPATDAALHGLGWRTKHTSTQTHVLGRNLTS